MEFVTLGKIINVRGLKGELKLKSFSDFSKQRYTKGNKIYFCNEEDDTRLEFTVNTYHRADQFDYIIVDEIKDVDTANKYRDYLIQVPIDLLPKLKNGSYYFYQLEHCKVYDEEHNYVGEVLKVDDNTAQNVLRVKGESKTILIPFVSFFIKEVDVNKKEIIVHLLEGLI